MSFAKNDNTFPTVSLVPIVLAAGTVYIGRRYFANLLLNRSSTDTVSNPISRRRRFAKYSLPRRPYPVLVNNGIACDCLKKPNNLASEPIQTISDTYNMPAGGNRRLSRNNKTNSVVPAAVSLVSSDTSGAKYSPLGNNGDGVTAPKHIPFPVTPVDPELAFEFMMFVFTLLAAGLQFVHLYRSVWWLPHAYTNHSLNFYLIDTFIVVFIVTILSRRLVYAISSWLLQRMSPPKLLPILNKLLKLVILAVIFSVLTWCAYNIVQNHPVVNIFYLCYPVSVYLILFGINTSPFMELITTSEITYFDGNPLHSCSSSAPAIRAEVEMLKTDFNNRMKQILFNSVLNAYYVGFVPCCFAQSFLYYDVYWATQHLAFVWVGCFTMYTEQMVPAKYCDVLHRAALHLGGWTRAEVSSAGSSTGSSGSPRGSGNNSIQSWNPDVLYPSGAIVKHCRETYRTINNCNAAEPGNSTHSRFFVIFKNPSSALCGILGLQICLVFVQLFLLVRSSQWYHIISLALLLFVNYYTLFKLTRDYIVSWKVYKNIKRPSV